MDRTVNHDEAAELLGAYALDAVDPDEAAGVEEHLTTCPRCREELSAHHQVAGVLGNVGGAAPEHLWDAIESAIAAEGGGSIERPEAASLARVHPIAPRRAKKRSFAIRAGVLVSAAAIAAIAVLAVEVARLDHRVAQAQRLAASKSLLAAAESALLDSTATRISLMSSGPAHEVVAEVVTTGSGSGFMFNRSLPALPPTRAYQLWTVSGGRAISAGVLGSNPGTVAFAMNPAVPADTFAVSIEPPTGSVSPTGTPIAAGTA
jgi:hypothetical protein